MIDKGILQLIIFSIVATIESPFSQALPIKNKNPLFYGIIEKNYRYQIEKFAITKDNKIKEIARSGWQPGSPQNIAVSESGKSIYVSNATDDKISKFIEKNHCIVNSKIVYVSFSPWFITPYHQILLSSTLLGEKIYLLRIAATAQNLSNIIIPGSAIENNQLLQVNNQSFFLVSSILGRGITIFDVRKHNYHYLLFPYLKDNLPIKRPYWIIEKNTASKIYIKNIGKITYKNKRQRELAIEHTKQSIIDTSGKNIIAMSTHGIIRIYRWDNNIGYHPIQIISSLADHGSNRMIKINNHLITITGNFHNLDLYRINKKGYLYFDYSYQTSPENYLLSIVP